MMPSLLAVVAFWHLINAKGATPPLAINLSCSVQDGENSFSFVIAVYVAHIVEQIA